MKQYKLILLLLSVFGLTFLHAQHLEEGDVAENRLIDIFSSGHIHGHVRNYFMNTLNEGNLNNYYANAIGGAIRYETADYNGFRLGVAGIFTYKAFSNDLNAPDPLTGEFAKWEHELFDVLDVDNFNDLDRLEELYIEYRFRKGSITYGKLEIEDTPLINRMDGRMKPFAFKGFWLNYDMPAQNSLRIAWLDRISPRSTVEWFDFNEGIGLFDNGWQPDGTRADYFEHLESDGVALLSYAATKRHLSIEIHHWYLHHISQTSWLQLEWRQKSARLGIQYALQFPDPSQRELAYGQRYIQPGENGQVLSGMLGWYPGNWSLVGAYSHGFKSGRFLFPKELGRDQFYTSINRSRMEGFGNVDVATIKVHYQLADRALQVGLSYTELWGPETGTYRFNKYDLDAYRQLNADLEYVFHGFLEGARLKFLYVYKENKQNDTPIQIFNRSNFQQFNLVLNFDF